MLDALIDIGLDLGPRWLRRTFPLLTLALVCFLALCQPVRDAVVHWLLAFEVHKMQPLLRQLTHDLTQMHLPKPVPSP